MDELQKELVKNCKKCILNMDLHRKISGLGNFLYVHRTSKDISLSEISDRTGIPINILESIETGSCMHMPINCYISFANCIGFDLAFIFTY